MNKATVDAAKSAKMRLEHYYRMTVDQAIERNQRRTDLELSLIHI